MNRDELASLASRSVWKMYRIKLAYPTSTTTISTELGTTIQTDTTRAWSVPGLKDLAPDLKIESIRQIDLLEGILHAGDDDVRSRPYFNPPFVVGAVSQNCRSREAVLRTLDITKPTDALLEIGISVDSERKLIVFDRHVYTKGGTVTVPLDVEPQLVLVTSVHVRDQDGRYVRFWDLSGESRTYPGVLPIDPDGAIREVTWSVGGIQAATTTVSRNTEHAYWQPPYEFRRNQIRTKSVVDKGLSPYG